MIKSKLSNNQVLTDNRPRAAISVFNLKPKSISAQHVTEIGLPFPPIIVNVLTKMCDYIIELHQGI